MNCCEKNDEEDFKLENDSQSDPELIKKRNIIKRERDYCVKVNSELLKQCKEHKKILDMRYDDIYKFITIIQTSVIISSTVSSFIQALSPTIELTKDIEFTITLIVTTYISVILSLAKFFKLDDKKESIHNLREKFAELHNKIRYRLDTLKPWSSPEFINVHDHESKYKCWETEKEKSYMDYNKIIEDKQALFMEFEKLIDSKLKNKYLVLINEELKQNNKILAKKCALQGRLQGIKHDIISKNDENSDSDSDSEHELNSKNNIVTRDRHLTIAENV